MQKESKIKLSETLFKDKSLEEGYVAELLMLLSSIDDNRNVGRKVSRQFLASNLKISLSTLDKTIRKAQEENYLKVYSNKGKKFGKGVNTYHICNRKDFARKMFVNREYVLTAEEVVSSPYYLDYNSYLPLDFIKKWEFVEFLCEYAKYNERLRLNVILEDLERIFNEWFNKIYGNRKEIGTSKYRFCAKGFSLAVWEHSKVSDKYRFIRNAHAYMNNLLNMFGLEAMENIHSYIKASREFEYDTMELCEKYLVCLYSPMKLKDMRDIDVMAVANKLKVCTRNYFFLDRNFYRKAKQVLSSMDIKVFFRTRVSQITDGCKIAHMTGRDISRRIGVGIVSTYNCMKNLEKVGWVKRTRDDVMEAFKYVLEDIGGVADNLKENFKLTVRGGVFRNIKGLVKQFANRWNKKSLLQMCAEGNGLYSERDQVIEALKEIPATVRLRVA